MTNFLMNAPTNTAKRILCAATLFFGLGLTAQAQIGSIAALTPDYQVGGSTISVNSKNTGTDGLIFNAGPYSGQSLQVMTWDAPTTGNTVPGLEHSEWHRAAYRCRYANHHALHDPG